MSENPGAEFFSSGDADVTDDPMTCAYEDFQESDEWSKALSAVAGVKVDDVDAGPFTFRDIPLSEVVGSDAAIDVASEGIIIGFEAGFRYGRRETTLKKQAEVISSLATLIETAERNGPKAFEVTVQRAKRILARAPEVS
jgi:hypothetical protein